MPQHQAVRILDGIPGRQRNGARQGPQPGAREGANGVPGPLGSGPRLLCRGAWRHCTARHACSVPRGLLQRPVPRGTGCSGSRGGSGRDSAPRWVPRGLLRRPVSCGACWRGSRGGSGRDCAPRWVPRSKRAGAQGRSSANRRRARAKRGVPTGRRGWLGVSGGVFLGRVRPSS